MNYYLELFINSFKDFANYTWSEITFQVNPWYVNYFWWLVLLSLVVWVLEIKFPWRKDQPVIRKDFWLDTFYMFFNFYIFKLIIFIAASNVTAAVFEDFIGGDISKWAIIDMRQYSEWIQIVVFFLLTDLVQWLVHVSLHRFPVLWRFHKVHHSVEQMGFAAHLRYHWMENVFYTPAKYLAVMLIGHFQPEHAYLIYYFNIAIGHLNHSNIKLTYGPLKYLLNNPVMHLYHHAYELPDKHPNGVNYGITLSLWDYIFHTHYVPEDSGRIKLGFRGMEHFPKTFFGQLFYGFGGKASNGGEG